MTIPRSRRQAASPSSPRRSEAGTSLLGLSSMNPRLAALLPLVLLASSLCGSSQARAPGLQHRQLQQNFDLGGLVDNVVGVINNQLGNWQGLQGLLDQLKPVIQNAQVSAPATIQLANASACKDGSSANSTAVLSDAVRLISAAGVNVDSSNVNVTNFVCNGPNAVVDVAFLGTLQNLTQVQNLANLLVSNFTNIFQDKVVANLNATNATAVVLSPVVDLANNMMANLCSPLPSCLLDDQRLVDIKNEWDHISSDLLPKYVGNVSSIVGWDFVVPVPCRNVALNLTDLERLKSDAQQAVANASNISVDRVELNKTQCGVDYLVSRVRYVYDNTTDWRAFVDQINNLTTLRNHLPQQFIDAYNVSKDRVFTYFNITDLRDLQLPNNPVDVVVLGIKQLITPFSFNMSGNCSQVLANQDKFKGALQLSLALGLAQPLDYVNVTNVTCSADGKSILTGAQVYFNDVTGNATNLTALTNHINTQPNALMPAAFTSAFNIQDISTSSVTTTVGNLVSGGADAGSPGLTPSPPPSPKAAATNHVSLLTATLAAVTTLMLALYM